MQDAQRGPSLLLYSTKLSSLCIRSWVSWRLYLQVGKHNLRTHFDDFPKSQVPGRDFSTESSIGTVNLISYSNPSPHVRMGRLSFFRGLIPRRCRNIDTTSSSHSHNALETILTSTFIFVVYLALQHPGRKRRGVSTTPHAPIHPHVKRFAFKSAVPWSRVS